jgi:hypothetical protein
MNTLITLYLAVGALATTWTYYGAVISRRRVKWFTVTEHVTLGVAAIAVGLAWPFFLPGLGILAVRQLRRHGIPNLMGGLFHARIARIR